MLIGYARVSTEDQDLTLQRSALMEVGCERIYEEKVTGARRTRRNSLGCSTSFGRVMWWSCHDSTGWRGRRAICWRSPSSSTRWRPA